METEAKSELKRSAVADSTSGKSRHSDVRTSSGMFIDMGKVLRNEHGQKYDPHSDYFSDKVNIARGGHRIATVLMYLTNVEKGGETVFPFSQEHPHREVPVPDGNLSECGRQGVAGELLT